MAIGSIGSISFWQQDQDFWNQEQSASQSAARSDALINAIGGLMTTQAKGLASIANKTALNRVNAQLKAALESALQTARDSASASSTPQSSTIGSPATGTGTVPLTPTTALITLGIPANSKITVSDGKNTTTYASTGTDTVADLIAGINKIAYGHAQVTASLDSTGHLVLVGNNVQVSITVGGIFASNIGFGAKNSSFQPRAPSSSAASTSSTSSSSTAASSTGGASAPTGSSTGASTTQPGAVFFNSSYALNTGGTAETLLASTGLSGSLVNLVA